MEYKIVENMIVPKKDAKFIKLFIDEWCRREIIFFTCLISVAPFAFFIIPMTIYGSFTFILGFSFMVSIVPMVVIWLVNRSHQAYLASKRLHSDNKGVVMSAIDSDNPLMKEVFEIYFNNNSSRVEHKCIEVMEAIMEKDELNKSLNKSLNKGDLKDIEDEIAIDSFLSTVEAMKELNGD